jgi:hypothetical protein
MIGPLLLALGVAAVDPRVVEAQQLAAHGEAAAARGVYEAILQDLEAGDADGSAALHYDIGTLALVQGEPGPAMLHLLAAWRRVPGDDDTAHNLARAREARVDRVESTGVDVGTGGVGSALPPRGTRVFAAAALLALGLALLVRGLVGARLPSGVVAATAAVALVAVMAWGVRRQFEARVLVVVQQDTVARSAPDEKSAGFDVHPGLVGERVDATASYARVRLENGLDVWLASSALRAVP